MSIVPLHTSAHYYIPLTQSSFTPVGTYYYVYFQSIGPLGRCFHRVAMCVCMSVCLFVCLMSPFNVIFFEAYFAPTFRSRMSKVFRDSESLGKNAGKKWSQNWTFLLGRGLKSPRKKKVYFLLIFTAPGVKTGCINRTIFVLEHSILTLGALLT